MNQCLIPISSGHLKGPRPSGIPHLFYPGVGGVCWVNEGALSAPKLGRPKMFRSSRTQGHSSATVHCWHTPVCLLRASSEACSPCLVEGPQWGRTSYAHVSHLLTFTPWLRLSLLTSLPMPPPYLPGSLPKWTLASNTLSWGLLWGGTQKDKGLIFETPIKTPALMFWK